MDPKDIQPVIANVVEGKIGVTLLDAQLDQPDFILDRTQDNAIQVSIKIRGSSATNLHTFDDEFTLSAYLESADGGTNMALTPLNVKCKQGKLTGPVLEFPPAVPADLTTIPIPANTIPAGVYRLTVILTHNAFTRPQVFGFVDYGMIEFTDAPLV